jgi:ribosomal protein S4E
MAIKEFDPVGSISIPKDSEWTMDDLPEDGNVDIVIIAEAPLLWRYVYDENGDIELEAENDENGNKKPKRTMTNQRGVRIKITIDGQSYTNTTGKDISNVPSIYKEGEEIVLVEGATYKFYSDCIVRYGVKKVL